MMNMSDSRAWPTRALRVQDLSDEAAMALEQAEMDPRHAHLDALMDD